MIVADTDVLIDYIDNREPAAEAVFLALRRLQFPRPHEQENLLRLLDRIPILPLDRHTAQRAAEIRRELERAGGGVGMADSLIAGIVLAHDASLLTRNRRHFERVPNLALADLNR